MNPEAIEAAANAISECSGMRFDGFWSRVEDLEPEDREYALKEASAALAAAAPYLIREARAAELEAAAESLDVPEFPDRAYYSSGYRKAMSEAQEVLRARAAAIRAGAE